MKILLAEDNPANELVASMMLKRLGVVPDIARDGVEVLSMCEQSQYDIILMDLNMPQLDGFETTAALNARYESSEQRPDIYALTANVLQVTRDRCKELGMAGFITKPLRLNDLAVVFGNVEPEEAPAPSAPEDLDLVLFESIMTGQMGLTCRPLFDDMIKQMNDSYQSMDKLAQSADQKELGDLIHMLRGSCGMFGMVKVSEILGDFEQGARNNSVVPAEGWLTGLREHFNSGVRLLQDRLS